MAIEKNQRIKAEDVRQGLTIWDSDLEYQINATCYYADEDTGIPYTIYRNVTGINTSTNPSEDTINWEALKLGGGSANLPMFFDHRFPWKPQDVSWVNSENYSWLYKTPYIGAYNYLVKRYQPTGKFREGNTYYVISFSDGDIQTTDVTVASGTVSDLQTWAIGEGYTTTGSTIATLVVSKILTAETETIAGTTISFYRCYDKKKIVLPTEVTNVDAVYAATGIAEYFILDIENLRFKLPRNKWGHYGTGSGDSGDYIEESVPNIHGSLGYLSSNCGSSSGATDSGALYWQNPTSEMSSRGSATGYGFDVGFNASRSSSAYKDNAPVQPRGTKGDLYFYLGSADLDEIININFDILNNKANIELNNLDDKGKNIANWSSNVTNCITEIPQDIKLELNNGTVTGKAGSKVYIANENFEPLIIPTDKTLTYNQNGKAVIWYDSTINILRTFPQSICFSGNTVPTFAGNYAYWFDTANNKCKFTGNAGSTWTENQSLPLAVVTVSDGAISNIDQIFNGFGYIGSHGFIFPNVKVLASDGINQDGSLKNIKYTTSNLIVRQIAYGPSATKYWWLNTNNTFDIYNQLEYIISEEEPTASGRVEWYKPSENTLYIRSSASNPWVKTNKALVAKEQIDSNSKITSFTTKTTFHAVDYNDFNEHRLVDFQQPTLSNNYTWYRLYSDGWVEQGGHATLSQVGTATVTLLVPMLDINYQIYLQSYGSSLNANNDGNSVSARTTTNFTVASYNNNADADWEVKGMANLM